MNDVTTKGRERPILFSGPMVRAILAGAKTQTRRVMRPGGAPVHHERTEGAWRFLTGTRPGWGYFVDGPRGSDIRGGVEPCPYGVPGDRLWVRETWALVPRTAYAQSGVEQTIDPSSGYMAAVYRAGWERCAPGSWRPSIHMPRWASRILLEITEVRVERLQAITEEDARAEGLRLHACGWSDGVNGYDTVTARQAFGELWDENNGERAPWASNPWVWALTFRRVQP